MKTLAIGDNCIDYYVNLGQKYVGGCSVNFAVYMYQLGAESAYLGAVGSDENGRLVLKKLQDAKVDVSRVHVMKGATAVTEVDLEGNDRKFLGYREGVLKQFRLNKADDDFIQEVDLIHTSVYGNIDEKISDLSKKSVTCYDFGNKLEYKNRDQVLNAVQYAFFSYTHEDEFIRDYLKNAYRCNTECIVATLGENGSIAYDGMQFYRHGIRKVKTVDTIGAGDSFIAGFMYARMNGKDVLSCLQAGAAKAEETIQHFGAF